MAGALINAKYEALIALIEQIVDNHHSQLPAFRYAINLDDAALELAFWKLRIQEAIGDNELGEATQDTTLSDSSCFDAIPNPDTRDMILFFLTNAHLICSDILEHVRATPTINASTPPAAPLLSSPTKWIQAQIQNLNACLTYLDQIANHAGTPACNPAPAMTESYTSTTGDLRSREDAGVLSKRMDTVWRPTSALEPRLDEQHQEERNFSELSRSRTRSRAGTQPSDSNIVRSPVSTLAKVNDFPSVSPETPWRSRIPSYLESGGRSQYYPAHARSLSYSDSGYRTQSGPGSRHSDSIVVRDTAPTDSEVIDSRYKRKKSKFFKRGRVFETYWHEPGGKERNDDEVAGEDHVIDDDIDSNEDEKDTDEEALAIQPFRMTKDLKFGTSIHSTFRWFIVVREGEHSCVCVRIVRYQARGVSKSGIIKRNHAIAYVSGERPRMLADERPKRGERPMRPAIRIQPDEKDEVMHPMSRIDYSRTYTVEHNIKVRPFGLVHPHSEQDFYYHFRHVFLRDDDDGNDNDDGGDDDSEDDASDSSRLAEPFNRPTQESYRSIGSKIETTPSNRPLTPILQQRGRSLAGGYTQALQSANQASIPSYSQQQFEQPVQSISQQLLLRPHGLPQRPSSTQTQQHQYPLHSQQQPHPQAQSLRNIQEQYRHEQQQQQQQQSQEQEQQVRGESSSSRGKQSARYQGGRLTSRGYRS